VLGGDRTVEPGQAALINGAAAITQEIEEGSNTGGHVGAGVVVGGFALAEQYDASGKTFVEACVKAYEVCARIERGIYAMKSRMNQALPWLVRDPHSTWTTVGPALAGALSMDLNEDELAEVFRIAANLAVVSMHDPIDEGPPARNFTAGFSAQAGVNAALTADAGLTGSRSAMTEIYDPLREMLDGNLFNESFLQLGEDWEITRNYFKYYPSCRWTHSALGALQSVDEFDASEVERMDVYTYSNAAELSNQHPQNLTSAKFSIPYVLARHALDGDVRLDDFDNETVRESTVQELAGRVYVHADPNYDERLPAERVARVEVTLSNEDNLTETCENPLGDPENPIPEEQLHAKFRELVAWGLNEDVAKEATDALLDLPDRTVRSVGRRLLDGD